MIVLDASVLIAHLNDADAHHERARRVLENLLDEELAISPLTLAEVLTGPARAGHVARAVSAIRTLGVEEVGLPADAGVQLAQLRAQTGLRLPDCCVLLAAQQSEAAVATFDVALAASAHQLGMRVEDDS